MRLNAAVDLALSNHPNLRAAEAQTAAAGARIDVARIAYKPRTDLIWQENRATRNNIFGLLLPQSLISSNSGPVLRTTNKTGTWEGATGALLSWERDHIEQDRCAHPLRIQIDQLDGLAVLLGHQHLIGVCPSYFYFAARDHLPDHRVAIYALDPVGLLIATLANFRLPISHRLFLLRIQRRFQPSGQFGRRPGAPVVKEHHTRGLHRHVVVDRDNVDSRTA